MIIRETYRILDTRFAIETNVAKAAALIDRLGRNQGVPGVAVHAYCGNCGLRDVETRPHWPTVGVVTQHSLNEHAGRPC